MNINNRTTGFLLLLLLAFLTPAKAQDPLIDLQKANQLLNVAQERNRVASEELEELKSKRTRLEEDLTDLQDNTSKAAKVEKKRVEAEIKNIRKKEDDVLQRRRYATNLLVDVTEILSATPNKRAKFISEYEKRFGEIKIGNDANSPSVTQSPAVTPPTASKPTAPPMAQSENQTANPIPSNTEGAVKTKQTAQTDSKKKKKDATSTTKTPKKTQTKAESVESDMLSAETMPRPKKSSNAKSKTTPKTKAPAPSSEPTKTEETVTSTEPTVQQPIPTQTEPTNETSVSETKVAAASTAKSKKKKEKKPTTKSDVTPIVSNPNPSDGNEATTGSVAATETTIPSPTAATDAQESAKKKKEPKKAPAKPRTESSKSSVVYKKFDAKDDVLMNTPSNMNCNLAFDGMDNFTGKKKQETTPVVLFAHTDDFMRNAMKDKDYVTCWATATRVEGSRVVYLNLTITVQSKEAQRTFGFLDRGSYIIFRFINGKKVSLATQKTDIGAVDVDKGTTTFRAQLIIPETIELTQSELDAVRISWSIGYEDYEIYDMDILRDLFKCLDKTNPKP